MEETFVIPALIIGLTVVSLIRSRIVIIDNPKSREKNDNLAIQNNTKTITILFGSTTGTAKVFAETLKLKLSKLLRSQVNLKDAKDFDDDDIEKSSYLFIICSTWEYGQPPNKARRLYEWLKDYASDFRVSKNHLEQIAYSVFGLGGEIYGSNFCKPVIDMNKYLSELGATCLRDPVLGDDSSDVESKFNLWMSDIEIILASHWTREGKTVYTWHNDAPSSSNKKVKKTTLSSNTISGSGTTFSCSSGGNNHNAVQSRVDESTACCKSTPRSTTDMSHHLLPPEDEEVNDERGSDEIEEEDVINNEWVTYDLVDSDHDEIDEDGNGERGSDSNGVTSSVGGCGEGNESTLDVEDLGTAIAHQISPNKSAARRGVSSEQQAEPIREMVTKLQRKALTKEGYRIIGSHSAVKLCRWTKNQMRGRGGCYKHTFYGITSYQCMEATPSLACANKCVFCWRHHKNPVGTEWRWKTDDPGQIVQEAVTYHQSMINEMKGIPGVLPERLKEGYTVKHCALSLVGEPIMYPRINEMLQELHKRRISSFMVTNAQFPDKIRELDPVTQLYVSVDASTRDALKAIDRPLFKDFWDRFLASLQAMKLKQQRTVYRMTLVKDWNMDALDGYVELIEMGRPDFIEIKAMTYCGKSDASSLTMQNVPWHREVCAYGELIAERIKLREKGVVYSIATEHEHSCCILLAREDKFKINGLWHTWIDYDKFHCLIQKYYDTNGLAQFSSEDYMELTPEWALFQSTQRGFDPIENRWKRNKQGAMVEIEYKSSESGCG